MTRGRGIFDPLSTVLFDLDDTLLDSFDARVKALQQVFARAAISDPKAEQFLRGLQGTPLSEALAKLEARRKTEASLFEDYRRAYWTKGPGMIRLYPGVKRMLEELCSHGVRLGIVTQKARQLQVEWGSVGAAQELEELGVASLFSVIVGFEDVSHYKPHPEGINLALSRMEALPHQTLVVGDSAADMEAARSAGCWSCYATWGIPTEERGLEAVQADLVAETPDVFLGLFVGLSG